MRYSRRDFCKHLLSAGAALGLPSLMICSTESSRPSYIIFLSDDLGFGDLACYGNPINRTPNIDRFATEGVLLTDCHSGGTVCSPSRASLLTGRNPYRSGLYYIVGGGAHLQRQEITIASLLRDSGYDTCFVGKWHLSRFDNDSGQPTPGDHGFQHWFATAVNAFEGPRNPKHFYRNGERVGDVDGWYCDVIVREALDWLENRQHPENPFFLLVCSHEPHTPLAPPEQYSRMYDIETVRDLEQSVQYGGVQRPDKNIEAFKKYYYGTVTQLDHAFGTLMQGVDKLGLRENTLVFFTSDNGPEHPVNLEESRGEWEDPIRDRCFGTPGLLKGMKRYPYEGGHRVPGLIRWPGHVRPGSVSHELVNGTDILPTLCALSGIRVPEDRTIDGVSIVPVLDGRRMHRTKPVCWIFPAHEDTYYRMPHIALREKDHVLVGWFNEKGDDQLFMDWIKRARPVRFELFDLQEDLAQSQDLSRSDPQRVQSMSKRLEKLWADIQAEGPVWKDWMMK